MASVRLDEIHKTFDKKKYVIDDVSLCVEDKSFVVIIGPSGCGKTTLLNIIAGLELPTSGSVFINGNCVNKIEPKDRDIAMVFQSYALYPHLSVYENLAFALKVKQIRKDQIDKKVNDVAALLGIADLLGRKPKQLSGGQMQRVAIGKAIVRNPLVFLMDEPLSNLDANLKNSMRFELKKLHKELDTTFIYVTHDQVEAMTLATILVIMNEGKIQQVGTPYDVFMMPRNLFVGQFIGSPSMNVLECPITRRGKDNYANFLGMDLQIDIDYFKTNDHTNQIDNQILIGVRPDDFLISQSDIGIRVNIISYEVLGAEIILHCKPDIAVNKPLIVKASTNELLMKLHEVNICPKDERIHFFHPITGERLNK